MHQEFESDFSYSFCDGAIFCETLGLDLLQPDYDFPIVNSHPVQTIEDVQALKVTDPTKDGRMPVNLKSLKVIADKMGGNAEVAVLAFTQVPAVIQRTEGLKEGILKHATNAKIVAEVEAHNRETGLKAIENVLQKNPNLNVVVGVSDDAVLGGYEAMMAANRTGDDVCLVGLDAVDEAIAKIKEGGIYRGTVDIDPFGSGKIIIDTTKKVIDGETMSEMIKFPMVPVTSENIDQY